MRARLSAGAVALALLSVAGDAPAHESATGIVKERMEAMKSMAQNVKRMRNSIENKQDLAKIAAHARTIAELADKVPPLFPAGSNKHPSEASAKIWADCADFEKYAKAAAAAARNLAGADAGDAKVVAARLADLAKTCSGCHKKYREKR